MIKLALLTKNYISFQFLKTTRNILIVNMALADIFLCLITMPTAMLDLSYICWYLGEKEVSFPKFSHVNDILQEVYCKLMAFAQSTFVFFSSISIVLIALDRMLVVALPEYPQITTKHVRGRFFEIRYNMNLFQAYYFSFIGLILACLFSAPIFLNTKMNVLFKDASYCYEVY